MISSSKGFWLRKPTLVAQALAQGSARRLPQAVAQLSSVPTDVKLRLQNIYVYTVANADQEFVLLSGEVKFHDRVGICLEVTQVDPEVDSPAGSYARFLTTRSSLQQGGNRRLGLMFFAEADAHALVSKVC